MPGQIKKLSENVINKIAAGEVIKDPSAIVKEMVENSIDAKSTSISVHIRKGGLDLIEIADNGSGIDYDDFPLLCERFATSKIASSDDLRSVSSFGFRGEALASVSYVSNLSVISKTKASDIAYTARFFEGQLIGDTDEDQAPAPKPIQGHDGTIMTVEDLFMNIPSRKAGLSTAEEYSKVLKLLMKLAMHYHMISFTLKKDGKVELSTTNILRRERSDDEIRKDMISRFYGNTIGNNLLRFEVDLHDYKCHMKITLTKPDKAIKGKNLVLFINDRLVECDAIKKALGQAYSDSVFGIHDLGAEYFAYIDMKMKPEYIDVNVNPTKKEVHFLNEKLIADKLKDDTYALLKDNMNVKTFKTPLLTQLSFDGTQVSSTPSVTISEVKVKRENSLVRTDPKAQTLNKFFKQSEEKIGGVTITQISAASFTTKGSTVIEEEEDDAMEIEEEEKEKEEIFIEEKEKVVDERMMLIDRIIQGYAKKSNKETSKFLQNLVYIGASNNNYVCCQFEQQLILMNMIPLCEEVFYLVCLKQFGSFKTKGVQNLLNVGKILEEAIKEGESLDSKQCQNGSVSELAEKCLTKISNIEDTLKEHLSIVIVDGYLVSMPCILSDVSVREEDIGELLVRLCTEIVYNDTVEMIEEMCRALSFYMAWSLENANMENYEKGVKSQSDRLFEGHVFPLIKTEFSFCRVKREDLCVKLLQLEDIYRIFERC